MGIGFRIVPGLNRITAPLASRVPGGFFGRTFIRRRLGSRFWIGLRWGLVYIV